MPIVFDDEQPRKSRIVFDDEPKDTVFIEEGTPQNIGTIRPAPSAFERANQSFPGVRRGLQKGIEAVSAPFEFAGEAIRTAVTGPITGKRFEPPTIMGGKPTDLFSIPGRASRAAYQFGRTLPKGFGTALATGAKEFEREPRGIEAVADIGTGVGFAAMAPQAANAPLEATARTAKALFRGGKSVLRGTGKLASRGVQKFTEIPAENVENVFRNPTSLFTAPTQEKVKAAYARSEFPNATKNIGQIIEEGVGSAAAQVRRGARALKEFINTGKGDPRLILEGRKGLDKQIGSLQSQIDTSKGPGRAALITARRAKEELRAEFNKALDVLSPRLRQADATATERFKVAPFREMSLPGKINILSPAGILRAVPGLPGALGTTVSGLGAVAKGAEFLAQPVLRTGSAIQKAGRTGIIPAGVASSRNITKEQAQEIMREAKRRHPNLSTEELRNKARQIAKERGLAIPKRRKR